MADLTRPSRKPDDQRLKRPVLHLARVVLEAATPLSVSTGNPDGVFDTALVTDANDLPALPGSSLAGVLRHLWRATFGVERHDDELFGYQVKDRGDASRLTVSWGALLDSQGRAAEGLLPIADRGRLEDPLYQAALTLLDEPSFRNRVRLSHRGTAADTGKFDRAVLPRGHRFAVELRLWSASKDDPDWTRLLNLLAHPGLRLGGATRAGLGKLHCHACHRASFDLSQEAEVAAFRKLPKERHATVGLNEYHPTLAAQSLRAGTLRLRPRGFWRIGQGRDDLRVEQAKNADLLPVYEEMVTRDPQGRPVLSAKHLLFPAASLKGALAHRMSFHARRLAGAWVVGNEPPKDERPAAVDALLGSIKGRAGGQAGALVIDDAFLPVEQPRLTEVLHNSIDRFTGGVRNRVLYSELSVYGSTQAIDIALSLDLGRLARNGADLALVRRALKAALDDLCQGRLALGSRTTTGNGFFTGTLEGDLKTWLETKDTPPQAEQEEAA